MAKKGTVGFEPVDKAAAHLPGGAAGLPSAPVTQPVIRKRDDDTVREQSAAAAASPAQMENAMIQQILERQAVFGF